MSAVSNSYKRQQKPSHDVEYTVGTESALPASNVTHVPNFAPTTCHHAHPPPYQAHHGIPFNLNPGNIPANHFKADFSVPPHNTESYNESHNITHNARSTGSQLSASRPRIPSVNELLGSYQTNSRAIPTADPSVTSFSYGPFPSQGSFVDAGSRHKKPTPGPYYDISGGSLPRNPNPWFENNVSSNRSLSAPIKLPSLADCIAPPLKRVEPPKTQMIETPQSFDTSPKVVNARQSPSSETLAIKSLLNPQAEATCVPNADDTFASLIPSLKNVNINNFGGFLVQVLKKGHVDVPIDDFYNLLYNPDNLDSESEQRGKIEKSESSESRLEGLKLCHLVLEAFKAPHATLGPMAINPLRNSSLPSVSFHELLRTFLAIKIIFSCVESVHDYSRFQATLPRVSVYKAYYSICQKLIHKYPTISNSATFQQNIILGQSNIGKIFRLMYSNLNSKRLGSRGCSKFHYIGFRWNPDIVDKEIFSLLDFEVLQVKEYFKNQCGKSPKARSKSDLTASNTPPTKNEPGLITSAKVRVSTLPTKVTVSLPPEKPTSRLTPKDPLYTFVKLPYTYPVYDCSPRLWQEVAGSIPQHSNWAKSTMEKCSGVLNTHHVNVDPLVQKFNAGIYSEELSGVVLQAIQNLRKASTDTDVYLHLYLFVILLIFPAIIASDRELSSTSKTELRNCVGNCITALDSEVTNLNSADAVSLTNFTRILRKMVYINEMTSSTVNAAWKKCVVKEFIKDLETMGRYRAKPSALSPLEEILVSAIVMSINAYNFKLVDTSPEGSISTIQNIARSFNNAVMISSDMMQIETPIPSNGYSFNHSVDDVPYQIFKLSVRLFHNLFLLYPVIVQLPIPVISFILLHMHKEMQSHSSIREREPELAEETFKTWWVLGAMFQEYLGIISEVASLSARLA